MVPSTLLLTRGFSRAAAKAGFIRLSEEAAEATAIQAVEPSLEIIRTYGKDKFGEGLYNDAAYAKKYDE